MSVKGLEMAIKKVRGNEMILHLEGGEPLLWQRGPAFTDLLYRWCSAKRQAHLKSNGTIRPRKIFRDVFGLITLEPDLEVNPDMDFWKGQIEWYEQNAAPLWAPIVTEKTVDKVEKLFYPLDYERVLPQARQPKDYNLLVKTCVNMGWKVDIYREKGAPVEVKPNAS